MADSSKIQVYRVIPAEVDSFYGTKKFSFDHWLNLGIYHTRPSGHHIPLVIPTVVELIEVDEEINWKRGDYFYFKEDNFECGYHGFCELPIKYPMNTKGHHNTSIAKLIEHEDSIAELLQNAREQLPVDFRNNAVVNALMNKGLVNALMNKGFGN